MLFFTFRGRWICQIRKSPASLKCNQQGADCSTLNAQVKHWTDCCGESPPLSIWREKCITSTTWRRLPLETGFLWYCIMSWSSITSPLQLCSSQQGGTSGRVTHWADRRLDIFKHVNMRWHEETMRKGPHMSIYTTVKCCGQTHLLRALRWITKWWYYTRVSAQTYIFTIHETQLSRNWV